MPQNSLHIRRAVAGDETVLHALRIQALSEAPDAFGSTLDREIGRSAAEWQRWLSPSATFILDTPAGPRGIAAGVPDTADPSLVYLMAMWVHPDLRGTGAADLLVDEVVAWAEALGAGLIRLEVIQGNDRARHLYERHQFRPTGHTAERLRDGAIEVQMDRALGQSTSTGDASTRPTRPN